MPVWTPGLWAPGDNFTSEQANTLLSGPHCLLSAGSNQAIPHDTATPASFDAVIEANDRYDAVSTPATEIPVPIDGVYLIVAQATFAANATGVREMSVTADGGDVGDLSQLPSADRAWVGQVSAVKRLPAAAVVTLSLYQNSGANLDTSSATLGGCRLAVTWLGLR